MEGDANAFAGNPARFATKVGAFERVNVKPLRVDRPVQMESGRGRRSASGEA